MLLTLLCSFLFLGTLGVVIYAFSSPKPKNKYDYVHTRWSDPEGSLFLFAPFALWFAINIICLCICPASTRSDIKEFEAAKTTIHEQRNDSLSSYERATLTNKIVEENEWLAKNQFWANNLWMNWYCDKSILKVEPIK